MPHWEGKHVNSHTENPIFIAENMKNKNNNTFSYHHTESSADRISLCGIFTYNSTNKWAGQNESHHSKNEGQWYQNFFSLYLEVPATRIDEPSYMYVRFICLTLTLSAGLFGNTVTMVVMTRPSLRRQQISSRFATLAFCDLCCCLMRTVTWIGILFAFLGRPPPLRFSNDHWCRFTEYCFTSIHVAESWLVAFITLERAVAVVLPLQGGDICGQASGKYFISFCVCFPFAMLSYLPFVTVHVPGIGCATRTYPDMFYHFLITTTAVSALPLTLICICNLSIIVALKRQNMKVNSDNRTQKFKRVTNMVLAVSLAFLATVFPQASNVMMKISNPQWAWLQITDDLTAILLDVNYAINFYLYVITGKSMRREVRSLFTCCCHQADRQGNVRDG